jgi:D-sedoheptulose 7-phosphate isomerase
MLTALANDLGVDRIFSRQVEALARPGDVLVLFSTSGASGNLLSVLDLSLASEVTIVACAGYGGGPLAAHRRVNHKLVVDSPSVHRIQEAQGFLIDEICTQLEPSEVHT